MATCPICKKAPPDPAYRPFCSRRCADVDLQRWLSGVYAVPAEPLDGAPPPDDEE
ncbi:MAG: DNA gyrase inhibitor YacG [Caulobacterales bacterium]|nr:DNA gyrase inhibitor YacG [Caulobacterales bacterium]